ncbi:MAG TPA: CHAD domain-containing protein [Acidimicrobiia bacterium]|nr:CHAD domain-containing protein [Acidimicrobiia bacterium]
MTVIAATTPTSNQVVVTPLPDFRLGDLESLPVGLKRLTLHEMEVAASGFFDGEEAFSHAVHEARRATKRIRAVLRLIRGELGDRIFRFEDRWMRDTARLVSPVRESVALVESMDLLDRIYGHLLAGGALEETRTRLDLRRVRVETRVMEDPEIVVNVVENLEKAHGRYANWPVDDSARSIYGIGIRDEFAAIGPGLTETYAGGRAQMVDAYSHVDAAKFHVWRKSVRYLRHQMELITPIWPEVVVGMAISLERVGELLGQDHDLAVLVDRLDADTNLCPDPVERSLIRALANQRRADLQMAARILGRRIFAEEPESLTGRFDAYWEAREPASLAALNWVMS